MYVQYSTSSFAGYDVFQFSVEQVFEELNNHLIDKFYDETVDKCFFLIIYQPTYLESFKEGLMLIKKEKILQWVDRIEFIEALDSESHEYYLSSLWSVLNDFINTLKKRKNLPFMADAFIEDLEIFLDRLSHYKLN